MTDDHVCLFYGEPIERTRTDPYSAIPDRREAGVSLVLLPQVPWCT